jgi:hypothetical protein
MISTRLVELVIDTVVCLTLAKWETVSGQFGGYLTGWWPDHYSIVIFDITKVKGGSKLKFTQIGIPPHRYSGHYRGWIETYWTPMKEIFAMGKISERTRTGVHINRTERINRQRFRRKVSREA